MNEGKHRNVHSFALIVACVYNSFEPLQATLSTRKRVFCNGLHCYFFYI